MTTANDLKDLGKLVGDPLRGGKPEHKNDVPKLHEDAERALRMIISEGRKRQETMEAVEQLLKDVRDAQDEDSKYIEGLGGRIAALTTAVNETNRNLTLFMTEARERFNTLQQGQSRPAKEIKLKKKWYYKDELLKLMEPEKHYTVYDLHPRLLAMAPVDIDKEYLPELKNVSTALATLVNDNKLVRVAMNIFRLPAARDAA